MPPILIAFFIAVGLGAGSAVVEVPAWAGRYPSERFAKGPYSNITRTVPWRSARAVESCPVRLFVNIGGGGLRRLRVDGEEQLMDYGWGLGYTVRAGEERTFEVEIIHPVTRETERREVYFRCKKDIGRPAAANHWESRRQNDR